MYGLLVVGCCFIVGGGVVVICAEMLANFYTQRERRRIAESKEKHDELHG